MDFDVFFFFFTLSVFCLKELGKLIGRSSCRLWQMKDTSLIFLTPNYYGSMMKKAPYEAPVLELYQLRTFNLLNSMSYPSTIDADFDNPSEGGEWSHFDDMLF